MGHVRVEEKKPNQDFLVKVVKGITFKVGSVITEKPCIICGKKVRNKLAAYEGKIFLTDAYCHNRDRCVKKAIPIIEESPEFIKARKALAARPLTTVRNPTQTRVPPVQSWTEGRHYNYADQ